MPEKHQDKLVFTLLEVSKSIQKTLSDRYTSSFWVKAEMNKLNHYVHSGHCYPELVQKEQGKVIALVKSMLWSDDYQMINAQFLKYLNEPLKDGIKILFRARIVFDPAYGLSLHILDIDPSYTLGDLEHEKQESIKRLKEEGLFEQNKNLKLALLPQRLAIISVETSKGYADFLRVIDNQWGYKFFHVLFPSLLQGEKAIDSIISKLAQIEKVKRHFDVVVIIRGGGGDVGLSCYNDYELAKAIALFPLPIITGIGHATNFTVVEMVSFANAITPTKIAESLILKFHNYAGYIKRAQQTITNKAQVELTNKRYQLGSLVVQFRNIVTNKLRIQELQIQACQATLKQGVQGQCNRNKLYINQLQQTMSHSSFYQMNSATNHFRHLTQQLHQQAIWKHQRVNEEVKYLTENLLMASKVYLRSQQVNIQSLELNVNNMHPERVLKRGYSLTLSEGKAIKLDELSIGSTIETHLAEGKIISVVQVVINE